MGEWRRAESRISDERRDVDLDLVHRSLAATYWASHIPRAVVERSVANSIPFSLFRGREQIGFARVVTDRATFAYLADVFILEPHRGAGLGTWLIETIVSHPDLQGLRRWMLATRDAHGLYRRFGFVPLEDASRFMEKHEPDLYKKR